MAANLIEFDVTASIDTGGGLRFEKEVVLPSPAHDIHSLSISGDGHLNCSLTVLAANENEATDKAYLFSNFLADLLTYIYGARTKSVAITGCSHRTEEGVNLTANLNFWAEALLVKLVTANASQVLLELVQRALPQRARDL